MVGTLAWASTVQSSKTYTYQLANTEIQKPRPVQYVYSVEYLKGFVGEVSILYGLSAEEYQQMMATIQCESSWDEGIFSKGKISFGVAQFTRDTWNDFNKIRRTNLNYWNAKDQIDMMAWAWTNKMKNRWDCFNLLFSK